MGRTKWPHLSCEDEIIRSEINEMCRSGKTIKIIDAGCGTGDRLKNILENSRIDRRKIKSIYGLDFAKKMLSVARKQKYYGRPLYDGLLETDLRQSAGQYRGNLILCLWGVLNGVIYDRSSIFEKLKKLCANDGLIIFDIISTKRLSLLKKKESLLLNIHQDLKPFGNRETLWYSRNDSTIGYTKLFTADECNRCISSIGMMYKTVWGYNIRNPKPQIITQYTPSIPLSADQEYDIFLVSIMQRS